MNTVTTVSPVETTAISIAEGLALNLSKQTARLVRTVTKDSGAIRFCFLPTKSKAGDADLAGLGLKGQAAKGAIKAAKREIGSAMLALMVNVSGNGKMAFKSATLSKTGTLGIFFSQGDGSDVAALSAAEERAASAEAKIAAMEARLLELTATK